MIEVCMYCYEIYKYNFIKDNDEKFFDVNGEKRCPKASCDGYVVELDELIAPTIITLNKKGYITEFCCSGHWYKEHINTYIVFADEDYIPKELPHGFVLEKGRNTIRYKEDGDNQTFEYKFFKILEINKKLFKWANNLEYNYEIFTKE
jgi:hypothetical protein